MKKISLIILACLLLGTMFVPAGATAATPLTLHEQVSVDFPAGISFSLEVESDREVTDVRLRYSVERRGFVDSYAEVVPEFSPGKSVEAEWYWDMRRTGGLPPGTAVDYRWVISLAGGDTHMTDTATVIVEDDRYDWKSLTEGLVTLYWYYGDDGFAADLMEATQSALLRLADNTGAQLEEPVRLYIYKNGEALRGALIFAREWTGGVAFSGYGAVAIGISPTEAGMEWGRRVIAHELTHLVVGQVIFNPYSGIPTWLSEGLSMVAEGDLELDYQAVFQRAYNDDSLISVRSLASPFSAQSGEAYLSYAQSYYIVDYLINTYGRDRMLELLETFGEGSGYDEALLDVYGFDMDGLNGEWLASLG